MLYLGLFLVFCSDVSSTAIPEDVVLQAHAKAPGMLARQEVEKGVSSMNGTLTVEQLHQFYYEQPETMRQLMTLVQSGDVTACAAVIVAIENLFDTEDDERVKAKMAEVEGVVANADYTTFLESAEALRKRGDQNGGLSHYRVGLDSYFETNADQEEVKRFVANELPHIKDAAPMTYNMLLAKAYNYLQVSNGNAESRMAFELAQKLEEIILN